MYRTFLRVDDVFALLCLGLRLCFGGQILIFEFCVICLLQELREEISETEKREAKPKEDEIRKSTRNPRRLGSKILKEFVDFYKPDIHICGHVHKQGGKIITTKGQTQVFNVSHLSDMPYKLTGRKYLMLQFEKLKIIPKFNSVVMKDISFNSFIETYL